MAGLSGDSAHGGLPFCEARLRAALTSFHRPAYLGSGCSSRFGRNGQPGNDMSKLDSAVERFSGALDKLEATINRQVQRAQTAQRLQAEVDTLKEDRSELAEELDQIKAEARRLNELNERASETLADAIEGIREVLAEG
jgi:FtsZ-binding cell division protein ZapB